MIKINQKKNNIQIVTLCLLSALLASCSVFQPVKTASVASYALEAKFELTAKSTGDMTLLVSTPIAQPGFDSARMVYIKKPHEIEFFAQNKWVDTPARMLTPLLVQAIESSGKFVAVVTNRSAVTGDLRLDTEIIKFQQEFLTKPSQVRIEIRAQLIDISGRRVMATREFEVIELATSEDPYGGVLAANRAVKRILIQIAEFSTSERKPVGSRNTQE